MNEEQTKDDKVEKYVTDLPTDQVSQKIAEDAEIMSELLTSIAQNIVKPVDTELLSEILSRYPIPKTQTDDTQDYRMQATIYAEEFQSSSDIFYGTTLAVLAEETQTINALNEAYKIKEEFRRFVSQTGRIPPAKMLDHLKNVEQTIENLVAVKKAAGLDSTHKSVSDAYIDNFGQLVDNMQEMYADLVKQGPIPELETVVGQGKKRFSDLKEQQATLFEARSLYE